MPRFSMTVVLQAARVSIIGALAAGIVALTGPSRVEAATFNVTSTSDTADANWGDGVCANQAGLCTLRAAIQEANYGSLADTITFSSVYTFAIGDRLFVTYPITINGGNGNKQVLDGGGVGRVFEINSADVTLINLEIRNGAAPADGKGGNIYKGSGTLTLQNCSVHSGLAELGGGIYAYGGIISASFSSVGSNEATTHGGGIYQDGWGGISLSNTIVGGNTSQGDGGGIWFSAWLDPWITIVNSDVTGNQANAASGRGGGIYADDGIDLTIEYSTVADNSAYVGGGISHSGGGRLLVQSSAVTGNSAVDGGGIYYSTGLSTDDDLFVVNTTIAGNQADNNGGGVYFGYGNEGHLSSCTIAGNSADADADHDGIGGGVYSSYAGLVMRNTLIAANTDESPGMFDLYAPDCAVSSGVSIQSDDYNLIGFSNFLCAVTGDTAHNITSTILPIDPSLGALGANGCMTDTMPLLAGSRAINAGNPAGCVDHAGALITEDQCLANRVYSDACDIGAVESSLTNPIFTDGFESGGTTLWTVSFP